MLQLQILLESQDVERMLTGLQGGYSSAGLSSFLAAEIGPYLQERAARRFRNEGDDVSGPWMPLSETTHAFRISEGYAPDHPINKRTGRLENYIVGTSAGVNATTGGALLTFPKNAPRGETAAKLKTAQEGKLYPRTPARPVLGMNETDMAFAVSALDRYIRTAGGGSV